MNSPYPPSFVGNLILEQTRPFVCGKPLSASDHTLEFPLAAPSLLWARTWQKQGGIQFIRLPARLILPISLMRPAIWAWVARAQKF
jgi:hypothetical protein